MMQKEINIPKLLHELHGKRTSLFSLILVYFSGLTNSLIITYYTLPKEFPVWKMILFAIVVMDIAGGVIANFTNSTNHYYQEKSNLRIPFICLHVIHSVLFIVIFPADGTLFMFMGVYALLSCLFLNFIHNREDQRLIAIFLVSIGATAISIIPCDINFLKIIPLLFFLKLILGFSVKHSTTV